MGSLQSSSGTSSCLWVGLWTLSSPLISPQPLNQDSSLSETQMSGSLLPIPGPQSEPRMLGSQLPIPGPQFETGCQEVSPLYQVPSLSETWMSGNAAYVHPPYVLPEPTLLWGSGSPQSSLSILTLTLRRTKIFPSAHMRPCPF